MRLDARGIISLILVLTGSGLLVYVGSEYWFLYRSQRWLQVQWQQQTTSFSPSPAGLQSKLGAAFLSEVPGAPATGAATPQTFARLSIPKIHLDAIVIEGISKHDLSMGPGHLAGTALPGEAGNTVIMAHRDTFFRHIIELNQGDEIFLRRNGRLFRYQVTGKKVVQPREVSVLDPTIDPVLTLITCYPIHYIGPAPERLVVLSKLVP